MDKISGTVQFSPKKQDFRVEKIPQSHKSNQNSQTRVNNFLELAEERDSQTHQQLVQGANNFLNSSKELNTGPN